MVNIILIILFLNILSSFVFKNRTVLFCGIVAFSGEADFSPDAIRLLLFHNVERGKEGTGMWNNGKVIKESIDGKDFIKKHDILPERVFLGHTRMPSRGFYKQDKHAHPFQIGSIVSVHNGTIEEYYKLLTEVGLKSSDYDVDSEALAALLNAYQKKNFQILKNVKGKASIVWLNTENPNVIYAFRKNEDRPLFRGMRKEGMYISSTKDALETIACDKIEEFKISTIYKIENGKIVSASSIKDETLKKKEETVVTGYNQNRRFNDYDYNQNWGSGYYNHDDDDYQYPIGKIRNTYQKQIEFKKEEKKGSQFKFQGKIVLPDDYLIIEKDTKDLALKELKGKVVFVKDVFDDSTLKIADSPKSSNTTLITRISIDEVYQLQPSWIGKCMTSGLKDFEIGEYVFIRSIDRDNGTASVEKVEWDEKVYQVSIAAFRGLNVTELNEFIESLEKKGNIKKIEEVENKETKDEEPLKVDKWGLCKEDIASILRTRIDANTFFENIYEAESNLSMLQTKNEAMAGMLKYFIADSEFDKKAITELQNVCDEIGRFASKSRDLIDISITKIAEEYDG